MRNGETVTGFQMIDKRTSFKRDDGGGEGNKTRN